MEKKENLNQYEPEKNFNAEWIKNGLTNEAIEFAEEIGKKINNLSSSQIRNVFGEIKNIQMRLSDKTFEKEKSNFILLKAKLAYAEGRNKSNKSLRIFRKIFDNAHKEVHDEKTFKNFVSFITAILAYHKAAGGK